MEYSKINDHIEKVNHRLRDLLIVNGMAPYQSNDNDMHSRKIKRRNENESDNAGKRKRRNYCRLFTNKINYWLETVFAKYVV